MKRDLITHPLTGLSSKTWQYASSLMVVILKYCPFMKSSKILATEELIKLFIGQYLQTHFSI